MRLERFLVMLTWWLFPLGVLQAAELVGYLTGPNNVPVTSARLRLDATDAPQKLETTSDGQGFFRFASVDPGQRYKISVEADGYSAFVLNPVVLEGSRKTRLSLRLTPARQGVGQITELAETGSLEAHLSHTFSPRLAEGLLTSPNSTGLLSRLPGYHEETSLPGLTAPAYRGPTTHGATAAEHRYLLDGFDITHPLTGLPSLTLPLEFLQQVEVAAAGLPTPEGESTGYTVQTATRFGGNRTGGDLFLYATPFSDPNDATFDHEQAGTGRVSRQDRRLFAGQLGATLGGFLLQDRIWYFLGIAPEVSLDQISRCIGPVLDSTPAACGTGMLTQDEDYGIQIPAISRLTFNVTPDQLLQVSGYGQYRTRQGVVSPATDISTGIAGDPSTYLGVVRTVDWGVQGRYVLRLPSVRSRAQLQVGTLQLSDETFPEASDLDSDGISDGEAPSTTLMGASEVPGAICPEGTCTVEGYRTGGLGEVHAFTSSRTQVRLSALTRVPNLVGNHAIQYGLGGQLSFITHARRYTGGALYQLTSSEAGGTVTETQLESFLTGLPTASTVSGRSGEQRFSAYIDDAWALTEGLEVRVGTRLDSQQLLDRSLVAMGLAPAVSAQVAATYQYAWGRHHGAVALSAGRHTAPVPLWQVDAVYNTPSVASDTSPLPTLRTTSITGTAAAPSAQSQAAALELTPSARYAVVSDLQQPAQQELLLAWRQSLPGGFHVSLALLQRTLLQAVEPIRYGTSTAYLSNPGLDPVADGTPDLCFATSSAEDAPTVCVDSPDRLYRALEAQLVRTPALERGPSLRLSYVLSQLTGDYPGPIPQAVGQDPASLTTFYADANLTAATGTKNGFGPLPTDRQHRLRGVLSFDLPLGLRVGAAVQVASGAPLDVVSPSSSGEGLNYVYARGAAGRSGWVVTQQAMVGYRRPLGEGRALTLSATVLNPWQQRVAVRVDPRVVLNSALPQTGDTYEAGNTTALTCTSIAEGEAEPCQENATYQGALEYPAPRSLRVGARLTF